MNCLSMFDILQSVSILYRIIHVTSFFFSFTAIGFFEDQKSYTTYRSSDIKILVEVMVKHTKSKNNFEADLLLSEPSKLGDPWVPVYQTRVDFESQHFESAMSNLIKQPNINSTVIMRADILKENLFDIENGDSTFVSKLINKTPEFPSENPEDVILHRYLDDVELRKISLNNSELNLNTKCEVVRRIIPRNPFKDHIINQTCLVLSSANADYPNTKRDGPTDDSVLVVYIPHIQSSDEIPFYLPPVYGVGILYHKSTLSIQYLPFNYNNYRESPDIQSSLRNLNVAERPVRIALRLLQTSSKHSLGAKTGYEKRVNHDLVVPKIAFQNRYIALKKKYSSQLVNLWCESTDPKKHVFEDLAIAAFLIELWTIKYKSTDGFEFRDLGCGNGLLVYILNMEGYKGKGIDARSRKSWATYPEEVQSNLSEQIIIPSVLLKPHPALTRLIPNATDNFRYFQAPQIPSKSSCDCSIDPNSNGSTSNDKEQVSLRTYSSANLLESSQVCTTDDFPPNTFIIGNHSDELTCWIPLLGFPFMVIPCCSHALSGAKVRYSPRKQQKSNIQNISTYGALVDHTEDLAKQMGWVVEKEMLRIPSTRNAAIIATKKQPPFIGESEEIAQTRVLDVLALEGGAEGWVENSINLMKKAPRNH